MNFSYNKNKDPKKQGYFLSMIYLKNKKTSQSDIKNLKELNYHLH
jgi:hypothetical protein